MRKILILVFICLLTTHTVQSQDKTITGNVISGDDNFPLIGATVVVKESTSIGTITDFDGNYMLTVPEDAEFCPECGRPLEEIAIRADNEGHMLRTIHTKECLYCGLQFPESVDFCSKCGRQLKKAA